MEQKKYEDVLFSFLLPFDSHRAKRVKGCHEWNKWDVETKEELAMVAINKGMTYSHFQVCVHLCLL